MEAGPLAVAAWLCVGLGVAVLVARARGRPVPASARGALYVGGAAGGFIGGGLYRVVTGVQSSLPHGPGPAFAALGALGVVVAVVWAAGGGTTRNGGNSSRR